MDLLSQIKQDLLVAVKAREELRSNTLRMLLAALNNKEIEKKTLLSRVGKEFAPLTEQEIIQVIQKEVKQRKESAAGYRQGKREDLAQQEEAEAGILFAYLPEMLSEEQLRVKVVQAIKDLAISDISGMGKLMAYLSAELKSGADMCEVSRLVKQALTK